MSTDEASFRVPVAAPLTQQSGTAFGELVSLMQRLLAPDGCPWDREQDERSLRRYILEEAAEVVDAIDDGDDAGLCEELGDLSLQIAFLAELARRRGAFGPDDVFVGILQKMVRRHPHVFGDAAVSGSAEVVENWQAIKAAEKPNRHQGVLGNVPRNQSALTRASSLSKRAAGVGFDWPTAEAARDKVAEEWAELDEAIRGQQQAAQNEEFGDLLFALVNWARHLGIDPETALRDASIKFEKRFSAVELAVAEAGGWPQDERGRPTLGIEAERLESYWQRAKKEVQEK